MIALLKEIRRNPLLWLLLFVPVVFIVGKARPGAHTLLFLLSVLAIVPLATLLSHATESVAAKTGDAVGGLLNATLGNLTELVIALAAVARRPNDASKGVHRRRDRHQHVVHAGGVVSARRHQTPHAGIQPGQRPIAGRAALSGHDRAPGPVGDRPSRFHDRRGVHKQVERGACGAAHRRLRTRHALFAQDAPRVFWQRYTGGRRRRAVADRAGARHARGRHGAGGAGERDLRRIGAGGRGGVWDDARVCRVHRGGARGCGGGDGLGIFRRTQEPAGPERGHRARKRLPDRAFRGAGARLLSYIIGPAPMDLRFWPGAVVMMLIATLTASLVTNSGRSAWFVGVLVLMVYLIFALTLYLLPPGAR
jgi:hypothetical protein